MFARRPSGEDRCTWEGESIFARVQGVTRLVRRGDPHRFASVDSLPDPTFLRGRGLVSFSTNNYLGLATSQRLSRGRSTRLEQYGVGNCESRLLGGDLEIYRELEAKLAALKGKETAVLFATGYLTNMGVLSALAIAA